MHTRHIAADQLELALVARKTGVSARWCAMSEHVHTGPCKRTSYGRWHVPSRSMAQPMSRGDWHRALWQASTWGAREIRRAFGVGIRALQRENHFLIER
jgi:hypothetical protein